MAMQQTEIVHYKDTSLYKMLRAVLKSPIIILMLGDWRTGKTDTSLLVAHLALKWGLIDRIGSNIYTYDNPLVAYIVTTGKLKQWLYADKSTKLFILDEGLKWIYRRKAMSALNVDIITQIMPEVSKGHARMIFVSQINRLDKDAMHPAFCRAEWKKLSKKVMVCRSKHYPFRKFTHLPPSPIRFDADRPADFFNKEMLKKRDLGEMSLTYQACQLYSQDLPFNQIKRRLDLHAQQLKRHIQKGLKWFLENYEVPIDQTGSEIENAKEKALIEQKTPK